MSHTALRRVAVRLLHDPTLVRALREDPSRALAGVALSPEERSWLLEVPVAAWRTDPDRPHRVLSALRDEFPASFALAPARAEAFLRSSRFHAAIQDRGSLAVAFGEHVADQSDESVVAVARLETATAVVRRAPLRVQSSPPGRLRLTPAARVVRVARGGAELLGAVREARPRPRTGPGDEPMLVSRLPATLEVTIEPLSDALAELLERAASPQPRPVLEMLVRSLGGEQDEPAAIVDGLVADAVLV